MSADNRICVMEFCGLWNVWLGSRRTDYFEPPEDSTPFLTENVAMAYAHSIEPDVGEGTVQIVGRDEQLRGLSAHINYLSERLLRLALTGRQHYE